jgi:hypothetical protein
MSLWFVLVGGRLHNDLQDEQDLHDFYPDNLVNPVN